MKADKLFFLGLQLKLGWHFCQKLKPPFKNPGSATANLTKACELVCDTQETLQQFRTDEEWDKHYKYITESALIFGINLAPLRPSHNRQVPRRLQDGIILEIIGNRDTTSTSCECCCVFSNFRLDG